MDQRRRQLDALAHALRVGADRSVGRVAHLDRGDRRLRRGRDIGDGLQLGVYPYELASGQIPRDRLALRDEPDHRVDGGVAEGGPTADTHGPGRRGEEPGEQVQEVLLPAPFGPSSPVTPDPSAKETSFTATTLPYQRDTWSTCIAGTTAVIPSPSGSGGPRSPASRPRTPGRSRRTPSLPARR